MWLVLIVMFGCETKDPYEDTASATEQYDHYDPGGGSGDYGDLDGDGDVDGSGVEGGEDDEPALDGSCWFSADICIETNEADNEGWCSGLGGSPDAETCPEDFDGTCALPAGGDFTAEATAYYYNGFDGETACTVNGGTYTPRSTGDWSEDTG